MKLHLGLLVGALGMALLTGSADAGTLYFEFSNTSLGNVNGTVMGQILGLNPNGTSAPTDILITSYPAGLVAHGSYPTPIDVFAWTGGFTASGDTNTFTLSGGNFVSGSWSLEGANGDNDQLYINSNCCVLPDTNFFNIGSNDTLYVWNDMGVGPNGIQFSATPFVQSVPEPSALSLLLAGLGMIGGAFYFGRKKTMRA